MVFNSSSKVAAIVPIKLNSRRLPNKNFLSIGGHPLCFHVFDTLVKVADLDVYCYCSNPMVMDVLPHAVRYLPRDPCFDSDSVLARELFGSAISKLMEYEHIMISHATSPLVRLSSFQHALNFYFDNADAYDSVVAARRFYKYAWHQGASINYDPFAIVQTNDLSPVFVETSGFYLFRRTHFQETGSRIGHSPFFWNLPYDESVDIDTEEDFIEATKIYNYRSYTGDSGLPAQALPTISPSASAVRLTKPVLVIFDFDGVLIDSRECMRTAWHEASMLHHVDIPFEDFFSLVGFKFDDIMERLAIDPLIRSSFSEAYFESARTCSSKTALFEGVLDGLTALRRDGYLLAINTSKNAPNTSHLLSSLFSCVDFDYVCTPELIPSGRGKPAPDSLLLIASSLGVDPLDCVYCGDMGVDQLCAIRAGMRYFHAGWGFGNFIEMNTVWFEAFSDFSSYLAAIA
jgi:beta-phosphoglucomutase-like phosphatase (HAD superfamily)/CMP-N-acetylneuraminic acid synthetase